MLRKTRAFSNIKIRMWKVRALFLMNFISGDVHGPIDLAAVPIGAYHPRDFLKAQHVDPVEAVQIHQDIKAKKSVGIHWGTFELGREAFSWDPDGNSRLNCKRKIYRTKIFSRQLLANLFIFSCEKQSVTE